MYYVIDGLEFTCEIMEREIIAASDIRIEELQVLGEICEGRR